MSKREERYKLSGEIEIDNAFFITVDLTENPEETRELLRSIIKNTYRTLMSRGMKGCYVYFMDSALHEYFKVQIY